MSSTEGDTYGKCEVCQKPAKRRCSACKMVYYCRVEHQQGHWKQHKDACKPYEISYSGIMGRFLKASRDLKQGDVIFSETPLVFGPKPQRIEAGPFPCVGCCRLLHDQTCERCPKCFWPICSLDCEGLKIPSYHGFECNILRLRAPSEAKPFYEYYRFDILIILRGLYLQKQNPKKWKLMVNLEDHLKDRGPDTEIFKNIEEKVKFLERNYLMPLKIYEAKTGNMILPFTSADIIHSIYGILDVNATELNEEIDAMVLYSTGSLLEHNCNPNTMQVIDEKDNFRVTFRAALLIREGDHITSIYTHILWGTRARRDHLIQTKYFTCTCKRCQDPTEFATYISGLKCMGTEQELCGGVQLPRKPTKDDCYWECNKCKIQLPDKEIMKFVTHLNGEVDKVLAKNPTVQELEDILHKLLTFLHPNHYLVYTVKHSLVQLYGIEGDIEISNALVVDKLNMCQDLINITKKIDPGNARLSMYMGVLLNEQFIGKFKMLTRNYEEEKRDSFSGNVKEILKILNENKKVLQYEGNTPDGSKLYEVVCKNELKFQNWMKENGFK